MSTALVLGGGGVAGIAWITGLLAGLADNGEDVSGADLLVGTSAGATVAAQLGGPLGLEELYERQVDPARQALEIAVDVDLKAFGAQFSALLAGLTDPAEVRRALGAYALGADTVPEQRRRAVIESRLPSMEWPGRSLKIVAVDALSGEARAFERGSGVRLVDAVAASCAVPGIWPAVTIQGRKYLDGGVRSNSNLDYASGAERVLVVVPLGGSDFFLSECPLERSLAVLRGAGVEVAVVEPDEASLEAIGPNPLDPSTRGEAARAGRQQGRVLQLVYG